MVQENGATKHVAEKVCEELRGHLARIESPEENAIEHLLIKTGRYKGYFIDGSDETSESTWMFSNGRRMVWFNWSKGQPDDRGKAAQVMEIYKKNGLWNDGLCGWRKGLIVEWDE